MFHRGTNDVISVTEIATKESIVSRYFTLSEVDLEISCFQAQKLRVSLRLKPGYLGNYAVKDAKTCGLM